MPIDLKSLTPLIQAFDMPTSVGFYRDILGFEIETQSGPGDDFDWGLLRLGGTSLMLNTAHDRDKRPFAIEPGRLAAHADTGLFFFAQPLTKRTPTCRPRASMSNRRPYKAMG